MQKSYFHNYKFANENINKKNPSKSIYLNRKISVDINQLLNRVRINKKNDNNKKILYHSFVVLTISLLGIFITNLK